MIRIMGSW